MESTTERFKFTVWRVEKKMATTICVKVCGMKKKMDTSILLEILLALV